MVRAFFLGMAALLVACGAPQQPQQQATTYVPDECIELLEVDSVGGSTINEALWARKSSRDFTAEALSLEELSGVVWAAAGINRPENNHLTAPSALALYPIQTYLFLAEGVYRYEAEAHRLVRVAKGDHRALSAMQEFAYTAPVNLVYVADLARYDERGFAPEVGRMLAGLDAAGYAENVNLYAAGHGLKAITRGSYKAAEMLQLLGLDPAHYSVALAQTVGK